MGAILSRWKKKSSTLEVLEVIEKKIEALEATRQGNVAKQRRLVFLLILYSVILYILSAVVLYFYYLPNETKLRVLYSLPLLVFPFLVFFLKRFLHWFFVKRITQNEESLEKLKEQKKTMLEEVMEKETYKKAREILERFDPEQFKNLQTPAQTKPFGSSQENTSLRHRGNRVNSNIEHQRDNGSPIKSPARVEQTPHPQTPSHPLQQPRGNQAQQPLGTPRFPGTPAPGGPPGPPMIRSILPRERTFTDRIIEYLVGDGPQNRYALICKNCSSHNGMALREEFEYIAFRCCYCYAMNPPRKQRPSAPPIHQTSNVEEKKTLAAQDLPPLELEDSPLLSSDDEEDLSSEEVLAPSSSQSQEVFN